MKSLDTLGILITRPEHQAQTLAQAIDKLGCKSYRFPTIDIQPIVNTGLQDIDQYNMVIFVSPNAVIHSVNVFKQTSLQKLKIAAIGGGTAKILMQLNIPVDLQPEFQFTSEGLLALPALQNIAGQKIIIVSGEGGRKLISETLRARGAEVQELPCYRRLKPTTNPKFSKTDWENIHIIVATSKTALFNLLEMLDENERTYLQAKSLLVGSPRVAKIAKDLAVVKEVIIADNATDESILSKLKDICYG